MSASDGERTTREIRRLAAADAGDAGRRSYRAIEAWRGTSGHGLCYFLCLAEDGSPPAESGDGAAEGPPGDSRYDRRAVLAPDERLADLGEDRLRALFESARPLTVTERRFTAPDGRPWLVQNTGPVWADAGVAEGATGLLFTSLAGPRERARIAGGHVERLSEHEIVALRERAFAPADAPDEPVRS